MTNNRISSDSSNQSKAIRRLIRDLSDLDATSVSESEVGSDMLTLIIDKILDGEDISTRYPDLHQKILNNAELRQALIDALESIENERTHQNVSLPETTKGNLSFLAGSGPLPILEISDEQKWRSTWRSTLEQIQSIFSPIELAYRADSAQVEDPWFTLLRDEIEASGNVYTVALDCTLSSQTDDGLAIFLNLAVTLGSTSDQPQFPLQASLHWGEYKENVLITEQGRTRFPDVPLSTVMDEGYRNIKSGLSLSLETI